jgi:hypothetical protein
MPEVYLTAAELKGRRELPSCCLVCGRRQVSLEKVAFAANAGSTWTPIGSTTTMRYLTVTVPLCREHKDYFKGWGFLLLYIILGIFALFVVLILGSVFAACALGDKAGYLILPMWLLAVASIIGFAVFAVMGTKRGVHARGIDRGGMRLANVSQAFKDTLDELREEAGPEGDDSEEFESFSERGYHPERRDAQPRRLRRDDYDEDRPRRRPREDDDFDDRPRRPRDRGDDY